LTLLFYNFETEDYDVQQLSTAYWTSMTRQGCHGKIVNCFTSGRKYEDDDHTLWDSFYKADLGACIAMQSLPYDVKLADLGDFGPTFSFCDSLNYLACEARGPLSQFVAQDSSSVMN